MAESPAAAAATAADVSAVTAAVATGRKTIDVPFIRTRFVQFGQESGMSFTRDTRPDEVSFAQYDEMRADSIIMAALTLIKAPILGRLNQATVNCDDPAIKRVIEHVFLESGMFYRLARTSLRAYEFGVAFHEIEWVAEPLDITYIEKDKRTGAETTKQAWRGPGLWPKAFHDVNPNTVSYIKRKRPGDGSYDGFVQRASPIPIDLEAVNTFVYSHDSEWGNYWGKPLTKAGYPQYFWKQAAMKLWMAWLEKKADPARKGFHPIGETDGVDNSDLILAAALGLTGNAAVSIPSEAVSPTSNLRAWDIEELQTTDRTDVFRLTKRELDSDLLKAMFAPERTFSPANTTGTYSEAKAHQDVFLLTEDGRQEDLLDSVNHYAVARVVELNWGPNAPPCEIEVPGLTDEERDARRALLTNLIAANDPTLGGVIDVRGLAEQEGLPVTEGEPAPEVPTAVGAPTPPGPPTPPQQPGNPRGAAFGPQSASSQAGSPPPAGVPALADRAIHIHLEDAGVDLTRTSLPDEATVKRIEQRALELAARFLRQTEDTPA